MSERGREKREGGCVAWRWWMGKGGRARSFPPRPRRRIYLQYREKKNYWSTYHTRYCTVLYHSTSTVQYGSTTVLFCSGIVYLYFVYPGMIPRTTVTVTVTVTVDSLRYCFLLFLIPPWRMIFMTPPSLSTWGKSVAVHSGAMAQGFRRPRRPRRPVLLVRIRRVMSDGHRSDGRGQGTHQQLQSLISKFSNNL